MSYEQYRPSSGFNALPPVVKNLLIINILLYLTTLASDKIGLYDLTDILGLHSFLSDKFMPYQFITYLFMHDNQNILHIVMNMFALYMFGNILESYWGSKRFLIYYLITGIGAAVIQMIYNYYQISHLNTIIAGYTNTPDVDVFVKIMNEEFSFYKAEGNEQIKNIFDTIVTHWNEANSIDFLNALTLGVTNSPTVGASGSVFGILLAFGMLFPNTMLMFIFLPVPIKAKFVVIGYGLFELIMGLRNAPGDNVAHFAHLGGMLFGYILIKYWNKHSNRFY